MIKYDVYFLYVQKFKKLHINQKKTSQIELRGFLNLKT